MTSDLEVKPTRMILQLVDISIKYLYGVVEDIIIKVDKFIFSYGFCCDGHRRRQRGSFDTW